MSDLGIFIDESGDFGAFDVHSPYYIVSLVFHDQSKSIGENVARLNGALQYIDIPERAIHTGPLIRRESDYAFYDVVTRKKLFDSIFYFARKVDICQATVFIEKRKITDPMDINLVAMISKSLSMLLREYTEVFLGFDNLIVYYDNGQVELTKIIASVFGIMFGGRVEFKRALPSDKKLLQVADLVCTLKLLTLKHQQKNLSASEINFFSSAKDLKKSYLTLLQDKRFPDNL